MPSGPKRKRKPPHDPELRTHPVMVRYNDDEWREVKARAKGMPLAVYIRWMSLVGRKTE